MNGRVLVIGGGIGGLSLAIALRSRGMEVEVFEQASEFREVGSGVVLSPNGMKALASLSPEIASRVEQLGEETDPEHPFPFLRSNGTVVYAQSFGNLRARYGASMFCILRSDLHSVLRATCRPSPCTPVRS